MDVIIKHASFFKHANRQSCHKILFDGYFFLKQELCPWI